MNEEEDNLQSAYHTRRATLEDLPQLRGFWNEARLDAADLERRFTEFQVAFDAEEKLAGTLGLHIQNNQGLVHSEAFSDPESAAQVRPLLWQRLMTVAKNNGLLRLWALPTTSFYREQGMTDIDEASRARLPEGFGSPLADWVTLKLRDDNPAVKNMEKEFEVFAMAQRAESERRMDRAKAFRVLAYGLLVLALGALGLLAFVFGRLRQKRNP
jgi:N-acetylglutamate synthase-like GNAT family acetyltransferase